MGLEQKIQAKKIKQLRSEGYIVIKLTVTNMNGIPDLIAIPPNSDVKFIEVKTPNGKISPLQEAVMAKLKNHGLDVEVYRGE